MTASLTGEPADDGGNHGHHRKIEIKLRSRRFVSGPARAIGIGSEVAQPSGACALLNPSV